MNNISGVICNTQAQVDYVIIDELGLFKNHKPSTFYKILDEGSEGKFSHFLKKITEERMAFNWEINVIKGKEIQSLYFAGLFWMKQFFIQMSLEVAVPSFNPHLSNQQINGTLLSGPKESKTSNEKLNDISWLNNELINIQRELIKKNRQMDYLNKALEILARTDSLTGINNRREILDRAEIEFERAKREGQVFSLAILDMDDFKQINDTFGHQVGDEALMRVSECLQQSTRNYDAAGRIGGDEFLVFFSLDNEQTFLEILKRLLSKIESETIDVNNVHKLNLSASIGGVYVRPSDTSALDIKALISHADKMLYLAKNDEERSIVIGALED